VPQRQTLPEEGPQHDDNEHRSLSPVEMWIHIMHAPSIPQSI
jgi:hypothetical protein